MCYVGEAGFEPHNLLWALLGSIPSFTLLTPAGASLMCRRSRQSPVRVVHVRSPIELHALEQLREGRALASRLEDSALETAALSSPRVGRV